MLFSSHVLSEVQEVAERVAILRHGTVVEVAATGALIATWLLIPRFGLERTVVVGAAINLVCAAAVFVLARVRHDVHEESHEEHKEH